MEKLEEMSNDELQMMIKELEHEYPIQKNRILIEVIKMEDMEKKYLRAKKLIISRLKRWQNLHLEEIVYSIKVVAID